MQRLHFSGALLALPIVVSLTSFCFAQGVFEKRVSPVASDEKQSFQKQVKVALVVGVSKYPEVSGFSALHYAASDAADLAALLKTQGYLVSVLTDNNATRGAIVRTFHQLSETIDPDQGTLVFYFSGHGFAIAGKNYLAPVSASESDLAREGLAVDEVEQLMQSSKARRKLMLLDACRNDPSSDSKGAGGRSFQAFQAAEGLRILNSTRAGRVSYESAELRHGVFTAFVLQGLRGQAAGSDGLVTFHDLSDYVTDGVRRWGVDHNRVQVPYEAVGEKEASGDFLLAAIPDNPPASVAATQIPAPTPRQTLADRPNPREPVNTAPTSPASTPFIQLPPTSRQKAGLQVHMCKSSKVYVYPPSDSEHQFGPNEYRWGPERRKYVAALSGYSSPDFVIKVLETTDSDSKIEFAVRGQTLSGWVRSSDISASCPAR